MVCIQFFVSSAALLAVKEAAGAAAVFCAAAGTCKTKFTAMNHAIAECEISFMVLACLMGDEETGDQEAMSEVNLRPSQFDIRMGS
jgi:hypothetical protein